MLFQTFFRFAVILTCVISFSTFAQNTLPTELTNVGILERLGDQVKTSELPFTDDAGKQVLLSDYFKPGRPVVLALVYYQCPMLCTFAIQGLVDSLRKLEWTAGENFQLVMVSIDPKEGHELAKAKKDSLLKAYGRLGAEDHFHLLTGSEKSIKTLASQVGFGYRYEESTKQYAHAAGIFVLTPEGKISRVLHGIEYKPRDMRLSLVEASNGKIGSVLDRIVLFCFQYDPNLKGYALEAMRVVQVGAGFTVFLLGGFLFSFHRRDRRIRSQRQSASRGENNS